MNDFRLGGPPGAPRMPGGLPPPGAPIKIDLSLSSPATCVECQGTAFQLVHQIMIVPTVANTTGQEILVPQERWMCVQCKTVYLPDQLRVADRKERRKKQ